MSINNKHNILDGVDSESRSMSEREMSKGYAYLIIIVFAVITLTGIYYFKEKFLAGNLIFNENRDPGIMDFVDVTPYGDIKQIESDSDNDGISNWRELVYGTDAGSKNALSSGLSTDEAPIVMGSSTNLTALVSRDLYVASQYQKENPNINQDSLLGAIDTNYSNLLKPNEVYTLNTVSDADVNVYREYGNMMGLFFAVIYINGIDIELSELSQDNSDFNATKKKSEAIKNMCEASKIIKGIPIDMQSNHIDFISNCAHYVAVLNAFVGNKKDPYKALIAMKDHKMVINKLSVLYNTYKNEFTKAKYKYSSKDYGNYFYLIN